MNNASAKILDMLLNKYSQLIPLKHCIEEAFDMIQNTYKSNGILLVCGNGGSSADSDHIVGELMKGFHLKRPLSMELQDKIIKVGGHQDIEWVNSLQGAIPAICLSSQTALNTAIGNDIGYDEVFAQQILGYNNSNNCLLGISTSGNSKNIIKAGIVAKALGIKTIGLTGKRGGKMKDFFDLVLCVPEEDVAAVQELHLPIYHALCAMMEAENFSH